MLPANLTALVRVAEPVESIVTMEAAAESRLLDALAIAVERPQDALSCAYLLGYVVECTLKAALGRVFGLLPAADVFTGAVATLPPYQRHSLSDLLDACLVARRAPLIPLGALREGVWRSNVAAVALNSAVTFRYKSYGVPVALLASMYADVEWIIDHAQELWT